MKNKAQIQMGESIFIVIFILLIIVFGIIFFSQAEKEEIIKQKTKYDEFSTVELAKLTSSLPEVSCSTQGVQKSTCFDISKAQAFANLLNDSTQTSVTAEYYFSKLGNANITLQQVYPKVQTITLYYNEFGLDIVPNVKPAIIPVSVYDPITRQYGFGILYISKFSRSLR